MKKLQVELLHVQAAMAGLELKIEERLEDIERLKEHINISKLKEAELKEKLNQQQ